MLENWENGKLSQASAVLPYRAVANQKTCQAVQIFAGMPFFAPCFFEYQSLNFGTRCSNFGDISTVKGNEECVTRSDLLP